MSLAYITSAAKELWEISDLSAQSVAYELAHAQAVTSNLRVLRDLYGLPLSDEGAHIMGYFHDLGKSVGGKKNHEIRSAAMARASFGIAVTEEMIRAMGNHSSRRSQYILDRSLYMADKMSLVHSSAQERLRGKGIRVRPRLAIKYKQIKSCLKEWDKKKFVKGVEAIVSAQDGDVSLWLP